MCIGKRFVELELIILFLEVLRKFKLEWVGKPEMGYIKKMSNGPDRKLNIKFTPI